MTAKPADKKSFKRERKPPKKISRQYLENAALFYLQRYATSKENLRRVLMRKVNKSCRFHQVPVEDFEPLVDELIERYGKVGLIDDVVFSRARVTSLRRQGQSKQTILAKLQVKGLSKIQIETALAEVDAEREDPELAAARAHAKRKKLGPWRKKPLTDPKDRQKELAAMGRAGFEYTIARRALEMPRNDEEDM